MTRPTPANAKKNATAAAAHPAVIQPGTRVCRWPGRDLLTGARVEPDADVHVVSEYAWYGARSTREKATEYGVARLPGLARELKDWPARRANVMAAARLARDVLTGAAPEDDES